MRIAPAAVLILPLALAAQSAAPHRRHHYRRQLHITESQSGNGDLAQSSGGGSGVAVSDTPTTSAPAVTTTAAAPTTTPPAPTTSAAAPTTAAPTTSAAPPTTSVPSSGVPASNDPSPSSAAPTTSAAAPTTTAATPTDPTTITTKDTASASSSSSSAGTLSIITPTPIHPTAKPSSSASGSAAADKSSSGGLSKGAIIGIVVAASVVGLAAIIWTAIRKWKLRPSKRFDSRMQPIDFSPDNRELGDDFLEKTLHRSASNASADRQRQQFVADLDHENNLTAGVPEHDFTAGSGHAAAGYPVYDQYGNPHPAHDGYYANDGYGGYPPEAATGYPPQPGTAANYNYEYPSQDQQAHGYADVQRGSSPPHVQQHAVSPPGQAGWSDPLATSDFQLSGRPTAGEGPYAQAATYRY